MTIRTLQAIGYLGALVIAQGAARADGTHQPLVAVALVVAAAIALCSWALGRLWSRPIPRKGT